MSHTPGPWLSWWNDQLVIPASHADRKSGMAIDLDRDRDEFAQIICRVHSDAHRRGDPKANARLIASAPDLLAMLKEVRLRAEMSSLLWDEIEAVIAKAEGTP